MLYFTGEVFTTNMNKNKIIKSLIKTKKLKINFKNGRVYHWVGTRFKLKKFALHHGYKVYQFGYNNYKFKIRGNRMIWVASGKQIPKNHDIHHKDGRRTNDSIRNLKNLHFSINRSRKY